MTEITCKLLTGSAVPLYEQLYQWIVQEIHSGRLRPEERLPSKRSLSEHLHISRNTVESAYGLLMTEGYIRSVPRSGYTVCPLVPLSVETAENRRTASFDAARPEKPDCFVSFSTGTIDTSLFPYSSWARILKEVAYENPEILQKGHFQGEAHFRKTLSDLLHQYRGVDCSPEQIIIGAGMEYLLQRLLQLLPSEHGVAMENPGYTATYQAVRYSGHPIYPTGVDSMGMKLSELSRSGAKIACITPSHQFPTGVTMPVGRRTQFLAWAAEDEDRYIIEDDYDSEFRYATRPIPAMQSLDGGENVILIGSFNRTIAPAIRVAYMVLPPHLLLRYREAFSYGSCTVSRFEQQALDRFIERGLYGRHLRRERELYRKRALLLSEGLRTLPGARLTGNDAGLHFLLRIPGHSEGELIRLAAAEGVQLHGLSEYYHGGKAPDSTLVIGFGGCEERQIPEAVNRLQKAWN